MGDSTHAGRVVARSRWAGHLSSVAGDEVRWPDTRVTGRQEPVVRASGGVGRRSMM
jgi:hypothetical protein